MKIADNVFVYLKFARSANLSAARRGARTSNIPNLRASARSKKSNEMSRLLRVPGPSTAAKRSAAEGGADTLLLCDVAPLF